MFERKYSNSERAFSLPELVIVVAIIAILIAMLLLVLMHERDNASVVACEMNERRIAQALDEYSVDHQGQLPQGSNVVDAALFGGPNNPYMNQDLVDPADGLPYLWTAGPGSCQNPDAEYQIVDQGGHSSTSLVALLQGDDQQDSVAFCADRGLYAMQYAGGAGASVIKP